MKGVSNGSIKAAAERYGGLLALYKRLYDGEEVAFDLLASGKPSFEIGDSFTIQTRRAFFRRIQAIIPKGVDDSQKYLNGLANCEKEDTITMEVETDDRKDCAAQDVDSTEGAQTQRSVTDSEQLMMISLNAPIRIRQKNM